MPAQSLSELSITTLVDRLKRTTDQADKRKIRMALRKKGHSGGAGGPRGPRNNKKKVVKKGGLKGKRARPAAPQAVPVG